MRVAQLLALSFFVATAAELSAADAFRVRGGDAALFAAPGGGGEAICTVGSGDLLRLTGRSAGDWVQVSIPADCRLYVYSRLVSNGVVMATRLRVRSGPGIAFPAVGEVVKGDSLSVKSTEGDWLAISAPPSTHGWVRQKHRGDAATVSDVVQPTAPKAADRVVPPKRAVPPVPKPAPKPAVVSVVAPPKPAPKPVVKPVPPVVKPVVKSTARTQAVPEPKPVASVPVVVPKSVVRPVAVVRPTQPVAQNSSVVSGVKQLAVVDSWTPVGAASALDRAVAPVGGPVVLQGVLQRSGSWRPSLRGQYRLVTVGPGFPKTLCWLSGAVDASMRERHVEVKGRVTHRPGAREPWLVVQDMQLSR
jgi:hypothetical protein